MEEFAKLGASVYTCARDEHELTRVVADLKGQGYAVEGSPGDVCSSTDTRNLVEKATTFFGGTKHFVGIKRQTTPSHACIHTTNASASLPAYERSLMNLTMLAHHARASP